MTSSTQFERRWTRGYLSNEVLLRGKSGNDLDQRKNTSLVNQPNPRRAIEEPATIRFNHPDIKQTVLTFEQLRLQIEDCNVPSELATGNLSGLLREGHPQRLQRVVEVLLRAAVGVVERF